MTAHLARDKDYQPHEQKNVRRYCSRYAEQHDERVDMSKGVSHHLPSVSPGQDRLHVHIAEREWRDDRQTHTTEDRESERERRGPVA